MFWFLYKLGGKWDFFNREAGCGAGSGSEMIWSGSGSGSGLLKFPEPTGSGSGYGSGSTALYIKLEQVKRPAYAMECGSITWGV
jgi:hypothetical protein